MSRNVTLLEGVSSYGKSTFCFRYLVNADLSVRFLFDPDPGEFNPDVGEFADRLGLSPAYDEYTLALAVVRGWVAFDPHTMFPGRLEEAFAWFCEWSWNLSLKIPGQKVLVVNDAWNYCSPHSIPPGMAKIVQSGRHRRLHLMIVTTEPNKLNSSVLNGVSECVAFRLQSKQALALVTDQGFDANEVAALDRLQFVARNRDSGGELRGKVTI